MLFVSILTSNTDTSSSLQANNNNTTQQQIINVTQPKNSTIKVASKSIKQVNTTESIFADENTTLKSINTTNKPINTSNTSNTTNKPINTSNTTNKSINTTSVNTNTTNKSINTTKKQINTTSKTQNTTTKTENTTVKKQNTTNKTTNTTQVVNDKIVFWTSNGNQYHTTKECPTLSRSKNILSGSLSSCPKNEQCPTCAGIISNNVAEAKNTTVQQINTTNKTTNTTAKPVQQNTTQIKEQQTTQAPIPASNVNDPIVYWLGSSKVYHTNRNCQYIRGKAVNSGTLNQCPLSNKCSKCP